MVSKKYGKARSNTENDQVHAKILILLTLRSYLQRGCVIDVSPTTFISGPLIVFGILLKR